MVHAMTTRCPGAVLFTSTPSHHGGFEFFSKCGAGFEGRTTPLWSIGCCSRGLLEVSFSQKMPYLFILLTFLSWTLAFTYSVRPED